jgi:hypothetical protein
MMIQPGALAAVPSYAAVPAQAVAAVLQRLTGAGSLQQPLDVAFRRLESEQPELAGFIAGELSELEQAEAQALGYFLFLLVFMAFDEAFRPRLRRLDGEDLDRALELLVVDGEVRSQTCLAGSYSEDVVAVGQPALMDTIRGEIKAAAERVPEVDPILQALLVEVVALTAAVAPAQ